MIRILPLLIRFINNFSYIYVSLRRQNVLAMKGLLKGLRYISQIFVEEKVEEIEIGLPTDVKHVAHIGSDGPSSTQPTWMSEFSSAPSNDVPQSPARDMNGETPDSPSRRNTKKKHSRRRPSSEGGALGTDSPARDPTKPRRPKNANGESPAREVSSQTAKNNVDAKIPKHRKKSKETGTEKVPRPKDNSNPTTSDAVDERGL